MYNYFHLFFSPFRVVSPTISSSAHYSYSNWKFQTKANLQHAAITSQQKTSSHKTIINFNIIQCVYAQFDLADDVFDRLVIIRFRMVYLNEFFSTKSTNPNRTATTATLTGKKDRTQ